MKSPSTAASSASRCDRVDLPDGTVRRTIRDICAGEFERAPTVVAAAGVELRGVVGEREGGPPKKLTEAEPAVIELLFDLVEPPLRDHDVGQTPPNLRITARKRWPE